MALCRCLAEHARPSGRSADYVAYVEPVGYPETSVVCGRRGCERPGVIWMTESEVSEYGQGQRVFSGPNDFTKMKAGNAGVHRL